MTPPNAPRVATYCDCGKPIAGFAGVLACSSCGRVYSIGRMLLDALIPPRAPAAELLESTRQAGAETA